MFKRVMVAVIGVPALIAVLSFAPAWATMLLVAALCGVGAYELMHAVSGERGGRLLTVETIVTASVIPILLYLDKQLSTRAYPVVPAAALLFLLILFFCAILRYDRSKPVPFSDVTAALFSGLVFPLMLSCLLRLRLAPYGEILVWAPLAIAFGSDSLALFAGMLCGKHSLAPRVSPKKTVEGGVGGLLGGVAGMAALRAAAYLLGGVVLLEWWQIVVFGLLGSVVSQIGDLSFSVIKREFGVKDYGKLLPGHGGVLDRFDSVTFVAPLAWMIFLIL